MDASSSPWLWLVLPLLYLLFHPLGGPSLLGVVVCAVVRWRSKRRKLRSLAAAGLAAFGVLTVWSGIQIYRDVAPGGDGVLARVVTTDGVECLVTQRWNGWTEPYTVSFYSRAEGGKWGWCYIDHESDRWLRCELVEDPDRGVVRVLERGRPQAEYDSRGQTFSRYDASGRVSGRVDAPQKWRDPPTF